MRFAFSRSTKSDVERDELFARFGAAGFAGLQLKSNQYADYLDQPDRFLADWSGYPGVASGLIHGGVLTDLGIHEVRRVIRFGKAVGSALVVYWPRDPRGNPPGTDLEGFAARMSELGKEAIAAGTRLSLHHHHNQIVMTRNEIERFFGLIDPGTVGLTVDTAHLVKSSISDVAGVIRDFRSVIDNIHLKDYGAGEWKVLGRGDMDFAPIFAAIREIGFDGWVCADEESGADLPGALESCFRLMSAELPKEVATRP